MKHIGFKKRLEMIGLAEKKLITEAKKMGVKPSVELLARLAGFNGKRAAQSLHNWCKNNNRIIMKDPRVVVNE